MAPEYLAVGNFSMLRRVPKTRIASVLPVARDQPCLGRGRPRLFAPGRGRSRLPLLERLLRPDRGAEVLGRICGQGFTCNEAPTCLLPSPASGTSLRRCRRNGLPDWFSKDCAKAFTVEQRLPDSGRPRGLVSFWPAAPVHSFIEMLPGPTRESGRGSPGRGRRAAFTPLGFQEWKKRRAGYCWSRKASGGVPASGLWLPPAGFRSARCCASAAGRSRPSTARSTVARYTLPPSWASTGLRCADQRPA